MGYRIGDEVVIEGVRCLVVRSTPSINVYFVQIEDGENAGNIGLAYLAPEEEKSDASI